MKRRSLILGILALHCVSFARAADVAALIEKQLAAGAAVLQIPAGYHTLDRSPALRGRSNLLIRCEPGANITCTAGLDLLGCIFPTIEGGYWVGNGAPYGVLLGRWPTSASANYPVLRNVVFDGCWRDAALIVAAAEVGLAQSCVIMNTTGTAVIICNQYGDSSASTMQEFTLRDCQISSRTLATAPLLRLVKGKVLPGVNGAAPTTANLGPCILSDIHVNGGGFSTVAGLPGAVALELPGDMGQCDVITFSNLRAEVRGCQAFVKVSGNKQSPVNWLALRDCTVDIEGPLVSASAFTLAYPTIASVKWNYAKPSTPLVVCGVAVNASITATKLNAGVTLSQAQPLTAVGGL